MKIDFNKGKGLVPVVVQDETSLEVLMLGYMNAAAYARTLESGKVCFFSRTKNRLWTKGESSGNYLWVQSIKLDCDQDTLLIQAQAAGPTCHTGARSCFATESAKGFLYRLERTIQKRIENQVEGSYTYQLYERGINKMAQKVGEEAVELIIEAKDDCEKDFKNEAADLLYHFLILLKAKGMQLSDIEAVLAARAR